MINKENKMKIQIKEVWNSEGRSQKLAVIEVNGNQHDAIQSVWNWIRENRPDLSMADTIDAHGFHAVAI